MNRKRQLKQLCERYIWYVFIMLDMESFDYTSNQKRAEIHGKIADLLECSPMHGYLKWALNDLQASAGVPEDLPAREHWERLSKECAGTLVKNLMRIYG